MIGEFYCGLMSWLYAHHDGDRESMRRDWEENIRDDLIENCARVFEAGIMRPGMCRLLHSLGTWQKDGEVDAVVMYTSASDECWISRCCPSSVDPGRKWVGYVQHFLRPCIERAADSDGLYGGVLHRNNVVASVTADGATQKDFRKALEHLGYGQRSSTMRMLFVDDRPQNICDGGAKPRRGSIFAIPAYEKQPDVGVLNVWYRNVQRILAGRPDVQRRFDKFIDRHCQVSTQCILSPAVRRAERAIVRDLTARIVHVFNE